ncbi:MAG: hypothetical protein A2Z50_08235 [Nitrospirae bacterium RBG_19FT_COMBO_42_15]|nr:MAG: hypothetical protein A2Z50_08235 [Nitrospirae bacterium RBG_19FT_COMBO_42_15]
MGVDAALLLPPAASLKEIAIITLLPAVGRNIHFYTYSISDQNIQCKYRKVKKINQASKQKALLYPLSCGHRPHYDLSLIPLLCF